MQAKKRESCPHCHSFFILDIAQKNGRLGICLECEAVWQDLVIEDEDRPVNLIRPFLIAIMAIIVHILV